MTPKNWTLEGKNRTLGGWGVKNRQKRGCKVRTQPPQTQRASREDLFFFEQRFYPHFDCVSLLSASQC